MISADKSLVFNIFLLIIILQENFYKIQTLLLQQGDIKYADFIIGHGDDGL